MDAFDEETKILIRDIHCAWKSQASLSDYALLRDRIIAYRDKLDVQVTTLSTVVRLVVRKSAEYENKSDPSWQDFFALAATLPSEKDGEINNVDASKSNKKRPLNWNEICRSRNLAIIIALWSSEVVQYYKWDRVGQGQMRVIRTCAVHFPHFEATFVPRLNQVLLMRHCAAILHCQERTLNEAKIQPLKDFEIETIKSVSFDLDFQKKWLNNKDGVIPLDSTGTLLKDTRPRHYQMYLLQQDKYGVFEPRESPRSQKHNPGSNAPQVQVDGNVVPDDLFDMNQAMHAPTLSSIYETSTPTAGLANNADLYLTSASPVDQSLNDLITFDNAELTNEPLMSQTFPSNVFDLDPSLFPSLDGSSSVPGAAWDPQRALGPEFTSPSSPFTLEGDWTDSVSLWTQALTEPTSIQSSPGVPQPLQLEESNLCTKFRGGTRSEKDTMSGSSSSRKRARVSSSDCHIAVTSHGEGQQDAAGFNPRSHSTYHNTGGHISSSPQQAKTSPGLRGRSLKLHISSAPLSDTGDLTIEENLHNRHFFSLRSYMDLVSEVAEKDQQWRRALWFTPDTRWASIWSFSDRLGQGNACREEESHVLYLTADDMISHAKQGKPFGKPIVIKEGFTDSGMHTVAQTLELLQNFVTQPHSQIRVSETSVSAPFGNENISNSKLCPDLVPCPVRNVTKSHRPLFTMLPRFRLLETLAEGHHWDSQNGKQNSPIGARTYNGFNTVGLLGAFSGAHANAFYGSWTRVLEGTMYVMIVSGNKMASEWENFAQNPATWAPRGMHRLIVLEKDDVLLIPPGSRALHASHCASDCLTEGGILWDSFHVPETLQSIKWACENGLTDDEPLYSELPIILDRLQKLVCSQPERLGRSLNDFTYLENVRGGLESLNNQIHGAI